MFIIKIHKSAFFQSGEKILYFMSMAFANAFFSPLTQYMIFLNHILLVFLIKYILFPILTQFLLSVKSISALGFYQNSFSHRHIPIFSTVVTV